MADSCYQPRPGHISEKQTRPGTDKLKYLRIKAFIRNILRNSAALCTIVKINPSDLHLAWSQRRNTDRNNEKNDVGAWV
jgi:hypothetical protein